MKRSLLYAVLIAGGLVGCEVMNSGAPPINSEMMKAAAANGNSPEVIASGRSLLATRCTSCHSLEPVAAYTPTQWRANVVRMSNRAGLRDDEAQKIIAYLVAARESQNDTTQ